MPYKKVDPVEVKYMLKKRYHGHNTVCQKLREIFILTDNEEIKMAARVAMSMTKSMHNKLKWYRDNTVAKEK